MDDGMVLVHEARQILVQGVMPAPLGFRIKSEPAVRTYIQAYGTYVPIIVCQAQGASLPDSATADRRDRVVGDLPKAR